MKPFHYNQDPLYAAAASILQGRPLTEELNPNDFKSLIGKQVHHGSPGYPTKEVIAFIAPHQTKKGSFEVEFESGVFDVLSQDELYDLMNGDEIFYKSPHGGRSVIKLQEKDMQEHENPSSSKHMIKNQLQTIVRNSNECLQMVENDQQFPEWAQSKIAVAEEGIVSVAEYMQSHSSDDNELDEAIKPYVSSDGKGNFEIIGSSGKTLKYFKRDEYGQKAKEAAIKSLAKNFDKYMKGEEDQLVLSKDTEYMQSHSSGDDKIEEDVSLDEAANITPVKGKYIFFIEDRELYQLSPYKLLATLQVGRTLEPLMSLVNSGSDWKAVSVARGEDLVEIGALKSPQDSDEVAQWYVVNSMYKGITHLALIH